MIKVQHDTQIEKSAEECWSIFGGMYGESTSWKSGMSSSEPEASGLTLSEKLVPFSNSEKTFTYELIGLPFVVASAENEWKFSEPDGESTLQEMRELHQEFKYCIQNGKPHSRKIKELK